MFMKTEGRKKPVLGSMRCRGLILINRKRTRHFNPRRRIGNEQRLYYPLEQMRALFSPSDEFFRSSCQVELNKHEERRPCQGIHKSSR